jgi:hypothetical protein
VSPAKTATDNTYLDSSLLAYLCHRNPFPRIYLVAPNSFRALFRKLQKKPIARTHPVIAGLDLMTASRVSAPTQENAFLRYFESWPGIALEPTPSAHQLPRAPAEFRGLAVVV